MRHALKLLGVALTALATVALPSLAFAQESDDEDILVTGQRLSEEEAHREAVNYVRRVNAATGMRPVARWVAPICPRILGLSEQQAAIVNQRIRAIAADIGAPLAAAECNPNISIIFSDDGREMVSTIRRRRHSQFSEIPHGQRDTFYDAALPVRWWYQTEERSDINSQHTNGDPAFAAEVEGSTSSDNLGNGNVFQHYRSSRISTQALRAIRSAGVVIDVNEAHGVTLDSVAAYAAMVALAETRMGTNGHGDSILGLFDTPDRGDDLSPRDAAFLTELYRLPMDRPARTQRSMLVRALLDDPADEIETEG